MVEEYRGKEIIWQSVPILLVALFISIGSGTIISSQEEKLLVLPLLSLLIPAFINMGGDSASILGARLSSALHLGTIRPYEWNKDLFENVIGTIVVSILSFAFLGIAAYVFGIVLGMSMPLIQLVSLTVLGGLIASIIMSLLAVAAAFISYSRGLDPDNIVTPIMSTGGDIVGIAALFIALKLLGI